MERRLAAILAADVVGYSAMMEADEAGTFERLRSARRDVIEPEITRHHGRIFKLMGDGLFAEFGSVIDAVECAVALQSLLPQRNEALPVDQRIVLRIGINFSEVIVEGDDRYGEGVNVAARLEQLAEPGGICVSGKVASEVERKLSFGFERMGERRVKNIAEPIEVFRVRPDLQPSPRRLGGGGGLRLWHFLVLGLAILGLIGFAGYRFYLGMGGPASDTPAVAVLPFTAEGDETGNYFSDGVTEDVIAMLSRSPDLVVTSLGAAMAYKGSSVDPREIGRALNVEYVLEGSARQSNGKVRIVAQLIEVSSGRNVWSERFDREASDPWALQDEVTAQIVAALAGDRGQIKRLQYQEAWGKDSSTLGEYDYYLRGHEYYMRFTRADNERAGAIWQEGLSKYPNSTLLRLKLGWYFFNRPYLYFIGNPTEDYTSAALMARDAIGHSAISPLERRVYHWLNAYLMAQQGDCGAAEREAETTRNLVPYDAFAHGDLATIDILCGKLDTAVTALNEAIAGDAANAPYYRELLGWALLLKGEYARSEEQLAQATALDNLPLLRAINAARLGRPDLAAERVTAALKDNPALTLERWRAANFYSDPALLEAQLADLAAAGLPAQ